MQSSYLIALRALCEIHYNHFDKVFDTGNYDKQGGVDSQLGSAKASRVLKSIFHGEDVHAFTLPVTH